jgi:flagellar P-ring protein FlgI
MRSVRTCVLSTVVAALMIVLATTPAHAVRIKDLGQIYGPMENPIVGYGLVVGLSGTGDDSKFATAIKVLSNTLTNLRISSSPLEVRGAKNAAVVMVSATLPAYNHVGDRLNVQVASVGNAKSLVGGKLVICPLGVPDVAEMIALASGEIKVDDANPTSGAIEGGAIVQKSVPTDLIPGRKLTFRLLNADFSIATRIVEAIHQDMNIDTAGGQQPIARAADAATIEIALTDRQMEDPVPFISRIERLSVPGVAYDMEARVVLDEKKGAFWAINGNVEIAPVTVGYGTFQVEIKSQEAKTAQAAQTTTLDDLVLALKTQQATPEDVNGILKALEAAGALHAKVVRQ